MSTLAGSVSSFQCAQQLFPHTGTSSIIEPPLSAIAVFATVVIASPSVGSACWSNDPCAYETDALPIACKDNGAGERYQSGMAPPLFPTTLPTHAHLFSAKVLRQCTPLGCTQSVAAGVKELSPDCRYVVDAGYGAL